MIRETSCGAVVLRQQGQGIVVLTLQHAAGHWAFPKGHMEPGETEQDTALREIWEETGLRVRLDTAFRHVNTYSPKPGVLKDVIYFVAWAQQDMLALQQAEIQASAWLPPAAARARLTYENDRLLLDAVCAYIKKENNAL